jgi:hypothetical protein
MIQKTTELLYSLELRFEERLRIAIARSRAIGYPPNIFEGILNSLGGVKAAKMLVKDGNFQTGFIKVAKMGRLDLSVEQIMLEPEFEPLFSQEDLAAARWRLEQVCSMCRRSSR